MSKTQRNVVLTPKQQEVLRLRYQGFSLNKIAKMLGKSQQAVYDIVLRLRRKGMDV